MEQTYYFYDLETSGFSPRDDRIMQFAGVRTDMQLNQIGEPHNVLIRMTDEVVPSPEAIMVTGITPQKTIEEGISEAEFCSMFMTEIAKPNTVFLGYNSIRFDDEFMRHTLYRNFYDPYEWQWADQRSRWDILDVVRLTRALRPDSIAWPMSDKGVPTNRLELLTKENGLDHDNAHDALNDVYAAIAVAGLLKSRQPKLYDYMFEMRDRRKVASLVDSGSPLVYATGTYPAEYLHTSVVFKLSDAPERQGSLVYDLRYDPTEFIDMTPDELVAAWQRKKDEGIKLPIKTMQYNRCPAVAPLNVLDAASEQRIGLSRTLAEDNLSKFGDKLEVFTAAVLKALALLESERKIKYSSDTKDPESALYDTFLSNQDKPIMSTVRSATADELRTMTPVFNDKRLQTIFPRYKARNYPAILTDEEHAEWERYRTERLMSGGELSKLQLFFNKVITLAEVPDLTPQQQYLLEELHLYGESIIPAIEGDL